MDATAGADDDRIDSLLEDCLDRPEGEWPALLESRCAAHPALSGELRRRFGKLMSLGLLEERRPVHDEPARERLGHYRLVRTIGRGGMGVVYEARDEKLDRRVALKVIRSDQLMFGGTRLRFAREVRAASRLDHPNLCPIYEAGEFDGVPYLAMRYVEGETLAAVLDRRRAERAAGSKGLRATKHRDRLDSVLLVEKLARALHTAHEAGLVHRDVKPANVLIDADGEPVLVDFGLARDTDAELTGLTHTGDRLGTPAYMAPEQVSGSGVADRRTDVYALGVTLYECLTLRCPFESAAREELYHRIVTQPPTPPRHFDRSLDRELCVVLERALEKDPDDRFATAEELAEELRRVREHEPIHSRRPGVGQRAVRWCQRNRTAAGIMAAAFIGLCVSLWFLRESQLAADRNLALAWLQAAGEYEGRNPELAFKYAREALRLDGDPVIVAKIQEVTFQLRQLAVVTDTPASIARFSPDGRFVVATLPGEAARLFRRGADGWSAVEFVDEGWRATNQGYPPPAVFSADSQELALRGMKSVEVSRLDLRGASATALQRVTGGPGPELWSVHYHPDPKDRRFLVVYHQRTSVWHRESEHVIDLRRVGGREGSKTPELWTEARFLPDGSIAAAGRIWNADYAPVATLPPSRRSPAGWNWIAFVRVAPRHFVTASDKSHFRAFDFAGNLLSERQLPYRDESERLGIVQLDQAGGRLLATTGRGIWLLHARSLDVEGRWDTGAMIRDACFAPEGRRIATTDMRGRVRVWDLDGVLLDSFATQGTAASVGWFSGEGEVSRRDELITASDGGVRIWGFEVLRGVPAFAGLGNPDIAVSPSGDRVVVTSDSQGALYLCDARGTLLAKRSAKLGVAHVRFVRDHVVAVSSELSRTLLTWDTSAPLDDTGLRELETPQVLSGCQPALLADGRWLLLRDWRLRTWRPSDEALRGVRPGSAATNAHTAVSSDGAWAVLAASPDYGGLRTFALEEGDARHSRERVIWRPPEGRVERPRFVALSRDDRHLLAAVGKTACLWDLATPDRPADVFLGHQAIVCCVAFSIDGTRIATASDDGTIRIWDRAGRRTELTLRHEGVRRIAFTGSDHLVSAGTDGTVRWWVLDAEPLGPAVEALDVDELAEDERVRVSHLLGR